MPTFALTDAWGARDVVGVLAASETIFEREGPAAPDKARDSRVALAATSPRPACKRLAAEGSAREAASTLKRHPFYVQKLVRPGADFRTTSCAARSFACRASTTR